MGTDTHKNSSFDANYENVIFNVAKCTQNKYR